MAIKTEVVFFEGEAGRIECAIDYPEQEPIGWALCLHPHPLYQGTNTNKVITTFSRACAHQGLIAVRPNFRGVGQSEGVFDKSKGETMDMLAVIQQFLQQHPQVQDKPWFLGAFSFGTAVAAQLYAELQDRIASEEAFVELPQTVILMGSGVWRFSYRECVLPEDTLLIHGEKDEVLPLADVLNWLQDKNLPITVIPDAGHFFHGKLVLLKQIILQKILPYL